MPIYEYQCSKCKNRFEVKQDFNAEPQAECPQCREIARRVFYPAPIIFRGSGFYVTDSRPPKKDTGLEKSQGEPKTSKSSK